MRYGGGDYMNTHRFARELPRLIPRPGEPSCSPALQPSPLEFLPRYSSNMPFELRVKSLDPDYVVPLSFKDWRAGVDPLLERAMTLTTPDPVRQ